MGTSPASPGWWYVSDGGRKGPVSDQELQRLIVSRTFGPNSLVWKEGMESWQHVRQVQALAHLLASLPPDLPPTPRSTIEASQRTRSRTWKLGLGAAVAAAVVATLYVASPYYTLWRLKDAIENKDSLALERIVDWPSIRGWPI